MARLQAAGHGRKNRKWRAAVKYRFTERYLGSFDTKEEAERAEVEFRRKMRLEAGHGQRRRLPAA